MAGRGGSMALRCAAPLCRSSVDGQPPGACRLGAAPGAPCFGWRRVQGVREAHPGRSMSGAGALRRQFCANSLTARLPKRFTEGGRSATGADGAIRLPSAAGGLGETVRVRMLCRRKYLTLHKYGTSTAVALWPAPFRPPQRSQGFELPAFRARSLLDHHDTHESCAPTVAATGGQPTEEQGLPPCPGWPGRRACPLIA